MGGLGRYSKADWSLSTKHCHLCLSTAEMFGRRLSKRIESTILLFGWRLTFPNLDSLGIILTLSIAASMTAGLYFLEISSDRNRLRFARIYYYDNTIILLQLWEEFHCLHDFHLQFYIEIKVSIFCFYYIQ